MQIQKYVIRVCLHCNFVILKNKHIGVLGTNVAATSWLHWSPVSGNMGHRDSSLTHKKCYDCLHDKLRITYSRLVCLHFSCG